MSVAEPRVRSARARARSGAHRGRRGRRRSKAAARPPRSSAPSRCSAACAGKVIVSGVGKSGLLAHKLAGTLTSTGTPCGVPASDRRAARRRGLFARGDAALFVSKSGESEELIALLPYLSRHGIPLVSIVAAESSTLARRSDAALVTGPVREACPMDLTPTTSITLAQVMGDCLAVALLERRGFAGRGLPLSASGRPARPRRLAPRGRTHASRRRIAARRARGSAARGHARDHEQAPRHHHGASIGAGALAGVISDGDFKRILREARRIRGRSRPRDVMTRLAEPDRRAMRSWPPPCAPWKSARADPSPRSSWWTPARRPIGVLHLHDCLRAG